MNGRILVTGGAGFLGRGILRAAKNANWDAQFTIYSRDELKQHLCRDIYPNAHYVLGDIRDTERLALVMRGHDICIHAAALKYVPESEHNVNECVGINIVGSQAVISAAREARVKQVIAISTDKAVEPVNTYGLTKAVAEKIFYEASWLIPTVKFNLVRYGNVIGSSGSVLPVFKQQFETHGMVALTDPNMTRFWLDIDNAVKLIQIAATQRSGTITVPTDLKAVRIGDIAKSIAGQNIQIIGMRPGEKHHEKLLTLAEDAKTIRDNLFGREYGIYYPHGDVIHSEQVTIEITSDKAEPMDIEEFMAAAEDAETI